MVGRRGEHECLRGAADRKSEADAAGQGLHDGSAGGSASSVGAASAVPEQRGNDQNADDRRWRDRASASTPRSPPENAAIAPRWLEQERLSTSAPTARADALARSGRGDAVVRLGVSVERVREQLVATRDSGEEVRGQIPFTAEAKHALRR